MAFGTATHGIACSSDSCAATLRVSSPPMVISASISCLASVSLTLRMPSGTLCGSTREEPSIVPPRGRMPRTAGMSRGTVSPSTTPRQPSRKPVNS